MGQWGSAVKYKGILFLPYIETAAFQSATVYHLIKDVYTLDIDEANDIQGKALLYMKNKYIGQPYIKWITMTNADHLFCRSFEKLWDAMGRVENITTVFTAFETFLNAEVVAAIIDLDDRTMEFLANMAENARHDIHGLIHGGMKIKKAIGEVLINSILPVSVKNKIMFYFLFNERG